MRRGPLELCACRSYSVHALLDLRAALKGRAVSRAHVREDLVGWHLLQDVLEIRSRQLVAQGLLLDSGFDVDALVRRVVRAPTHLTRGLDLIPGDELVAETLLARNALRTMKTISAVRAATRRSAPVHVLAVSYTHLTLPTICSV